MSQLKFVICLQGSGSEERPDSPSDSLDGTKKGERKKEFVCQVGVLCKLQDHVNVYPRLTFAIRKRRLVPGLSSGSYNCYKIIT